MTKENKKILISLRKEYLKSYYSINTFVGCTINCAYCFLAPINIVPMRPIRVAEEEKLIDEMINDPLFENGKTVISLNNRTDPFINDEVKESTFALLRIMNERNVKNPITITTKGFLSEEDVKKLEAFSNLFLIIIVTYNGIPEIIQPIAKNVQERTMRNVSKSKRIMLLHQFRPIIYGLNDDPQTIRNIIEYAMNYCDASIYQGLRINAAIDERLKERQYYYNGAYDKHKQKSKEVDIMFKVLQEQHRDYPIFDHTSCAISYLLGDADYNQHFIKRECEASCKNYQHCKENYYPCDNAEIQGFFERIGINGEWTINGDDIVIEGSMSDEQRSFVRHIMHRDAKATKREYSFSEQLMD